MPDEKSPFIDDYDEAVDEVIFGDGERPDIGDSEDHPEFIDLDAPEEEEEEESEEEPEEEEVSEEESAEEGKEEEEKEEEEEEEEKEEEEEEEEEEKEEEEVSELDPDSIVSLTINGERVTKTWQEAQALAQKGEVFDRNNRQAAEDIKAAAEIKAKAEKRIADADAVLSVMDPGRFKSNPMALFVEVRTADVGPVKALEEARLAAQNVLDECAQLDALPESKRLEIFQESQDQHSKRIIDQANARAEKAEADAEVRVEQARVAAAATHLLRAIKEAGIEPTQQVTDGVTEEYMAAGRAGAEIEPETAVNRFLERSQTSDLATLAALPADALLKKLPPAMVEKLGLNKPKPQGLAKKKRLRAQKSESQPQRRKKQPTGRNKTSSEAPSTYDEATRISRKMQRSERR